MVYDSDMYPVQFDVEYAENRNRLTALVRIILAIPIGIVFALVAGIPLFNDEAQQGRQQCMELCTDMGLVSAWQWAAEGLNYAVLTLGFPLALALIILFRKKYPRWMFDFLLELSRFGARVGAYISLLRDEYPSTDDHQAVALDIAYPDGEQLNRIMPFIKWILAIPHWIILALLGIIVFFVTIIAWFAILIVGRYPEGLFNFTVGFMRWGQRVWAYSTLMATDRYPPFRFGP